MADTKAPAPAFEIVTVAPDSSVMVKVEAMHATFHGHAMHSCREIVGRAGATIEVPTAAAVELRARGYVV